MFIFTKCGFGTRVKENGATEAPICFKRCCLSLRDKPLGELLRSKSKEALNVRRASYRLKSLSDYPASGSLGGDPRSQVTNCSRLAHARHDGYFRQSMKPTGCLKRVIFKMLLEPRCACSITNSRHPSQLDLDEPVSGKYYFWLFLT